MAIRAEDAHMTVRTIPPRVQDGSAPPRSSVLREWLEYLPEPAAIVDGTARILAANGRFARCSRRRAALPVVDGRLTAAVEAADARLARRIVETLAGDGARAIVVPSSALDRALHLGLRPLRRAGHALVMVTVHDVDGGIPLSRRCLHDLFGLTPAEAAVVRELASGPLDVGAVAARLGASTHTVRTHVKHVFAKCGVQSQAQLMRLLALGPARLPAGGEIDDRDTADE